MIHWFDSRAGYTAAVTALQPARATIEGYLTGLDVLRGYCVACDRIVEFDVGPDDGIWRNLREGFVCGGCSLNARSRTVLTLLRDAIGRGTPRTLMLEHMTALYRQVRAEYPFVVGSEFLGPGVPAGEVRVFHGERVRHEDMQGLSFADASLDIVLHGDVLEHVPDHRQALRECARVLVEGGQMICSAPFFELEEHLVRAEVIDGDLVHHLDPAYHGNPISSEGSLVFNHHGWPLLDDMRAAGFGTVEIGLLYDPFQGIVSNNNPYPQGHMWPIVFRAVK